MVTRQPLRMVAAVAAAVVALSMLTACGGGSGGGESSGGKTRITVMGLPPTSDQAGRSAFKAQIAAFEKLNPDIVVTGSDATWDAQTFSTRLSGGKAETMIEVPLTEPQGLIKRRQVQDITDELTQWSEYKQYDQRLLGPNKDAKGNVYGLTLYQYALGLVYSRKLFAKAGLDPDRPPTTWDEVRQDAKQIHDRTGVVGFTPLSTQQGGGWHLTSMVYSRGGTMERENNGKQVAGFDNDQAKAALQWLHDLRFTDRSIGSKALNNQQDAQQAMAAGKTAMYIDGPGAISPMVQQFGANKNDYGFGAMPQDGGNATQLGGSVDMITKGVTKKQRAAAVKWMLYANIQPQVDPKLAVTQAKSLSTDPKNLIGVPGLPAFNQQVQDKVDAALKPYTNVNVAYFEPYLQGTAKLKLEPEPPVAAQELYRALDPVVQAVLTKQDANIDDLLAAASKQVDSLLQSAQ